MNEMEGSMKESHHDHGSYAPAKAAIHGTAEDSEIHGKVKFFEIEGGLKAVVFLSGVTPAGKHGLHIHANGSCEDGGKAAGGHYNPKGIDHGFLPDDGLEAAHAGDMGNIEIDEDGMGVLKVDLAGLSIDGEVGVLGHAIVLHAQEDDFGQPTGNAGGRIGCGVVKSKDEWKEMKGSSTEPKAEVEIEAETEGEAEDSSEET